MSTDELNEGVPRRGGEHPDELARPDPDGAIDLDGGSDRRNPEDIHLDVIRLDSSHLDIDGDGQPDPVDGLDEAVLAVGRFLVSEVPLGETLHRIAVLLRDALPSVTAVGLTLLDEDGRPTTPVFTDDVAPAVDAGQYEEGDGPCLAAYRTGKVVRVDDTADVVDLWPRFSEDALANGVRSTLGFPLVAGDVAFGAANLYGREVGAFSEDDEARAALFATQASAVLANARAYWAASDLAVNLQQAMENRAVIDQAKGKLMASAGCTPDEAFDLLVKASQRENVKVRVIALRIVERRDLGPA